jgi:hypothetical protein
VPASIARSCLKHLCDQQSVKRVWHPLITPATKTVLQNATFSSKAGQWEL